MNVALKILIVLGFLFVNGARGGRFGAPALPGHPRFWVSPLVVPLAWLAGYSLVQSLTLAVAFLTWSIPAWGRWFTLNRGEREWSGGPNWYEALIESISDIGGKRRDHVAFFIRHLIVLAPLAALPLFHLSSMIAGSLLIVLVYELSWTFTKDDNQIRNAEFATGVLFGVAVVAGVL